MSASATARLIDERPVAGLLEHLHLRVRERFPLALCVLHTQVGVVAARQHERRPVERAQGGGELMAGGGDVGHRSVEGKARVRHELERIAVRRARPVGQEGLQQPRHDVGHRAQVQRRAPVVAPLAEHVHEQRKSKRMAVAELEDLVVSCICDAGAAQVPACIVGREVPKGHHPQQLAPAGIATQRGPGPCRADRR